MTKLFITLAVGLLAVTTVQARLGWTLGKCREFYGADQEGVSPDGKQFDEFAKAGVKVIIVFTDDEAVYIRYLFDGNKPEPALHYIHDLIDRNSLGATWNYTPLKGGDGVEKWTEWNAFAQGKRRVVAQYQNLELLTVRYSELIREQERQSNPNLSCQSHCRAKTLGSPFTLNRKRQANHIYENS